MPLNISVDRGHAVVDPATLAAGTVVKVYGTVPLPYRRALVGLAASTAKRLHLTSAAHVVVGMAVAGTGVAANTTVASVSGNDITLNNAVTGTVASGETLTVTSTMTTTAATAAGTNLAVPTVGLSVGMGVTGTNIAGGATIQAIVDANNVTMSAAVTGAVASGASLVFTLPTITTSASTTPSSTSPLNLRVTTVDPDGLLGTSYEKVVGAVVYNEQKVSFGEVARFAARGWTLVPMANIAPAAPTYL